MSVNFKQQRDFATMGQVTIMMVLFSLMLVSLGFIGSDEELKAQSNSMDPIILHLHPHLSIFVNDVSLTVPAQIGIDPTLWKNHSLDEFGIQSMPEMNMSAMAPLHTHDDSGIIHVESTINRNYTLQEFLNIWGLDLDGRVVSITVDNEPVSDFMNHDLIDGEQIRLEVR